MTGFAFRAPRVMAAPNTFLPPLVLALVAVAAALPAPSFAQKTTPKSTASTGPKDSILTPAQLQECLKQKERLHAQTDDALKDKAQIEAEKAEIGRLGTSLSDELATIDRSSEDAVAAYNAKAEQVKTTKDSYEKACENRRYDERDLNDLKRKK